jgi:hypothetical protein
VVLVHAELRSKRQSDAPIEQRCDDAAVHNATRIEVVRLKVEVDFARTLAERHESQAHPLCELARTETLANRGLERRIKHGRDGSGASHQQANVRRKQAKRSSMTSTRKAEAPIDLWGRRCLPLSPAFSTQPIGAFRSAQVIGGGGQRQHRQKARSLRRSAGGTRERAMNIAESFFYARASS